jgi:uncharacterized membrane protein YbhN (UPF0104 family)
VEKYKTYLKFVGHILALTSIYILIKIFQENIDKIEHIELTSTNIIIIFSLILLGLINYLLVSISWVIQLKHKYQNFSLIHSFKIISTTQIAKYLPGNFGHFVGRFYLAKKHLNKIDITQSLLVENIMFVISSFLIGLLYLFYFDIFTILTLYTLILLFVVGVSILILVLFFINRTKIKLNFLEQNITTLLEVFSLFLIMSLIGGLTTKVLINLVIPSNDLSYVLCASGFAISFVLGYIVPGAPAGIGVREYSFTLLFAPFIGNIFALEVILIFRLLSLIIDLLLYLIGKWINVKKWTKNEI